MCDCLSVCACVGVIVRVGLVGGMGCVCVRVGLCVWSVGLFIVIIREIGPAT